MLFMIQAFQQLRYVPLSRWPLRYHAILSVVAVALIAVLAALCGHQIAKQGRRVADERLQLQAELTALRSNARTNPEPDFAQGLPSAHRSDDVVRDIGRFAQDAGVQISSLNVSTMIATPIQLGRVQFNISANAPYKATKAWLSDLLARYPSLAVGTLSLQAQPNDRSLQDVHLLLVWYFQDP